MLLRSGRLPTGDMPMSRNEMASARPSRGTSPSRQESPRLGHDQPRPELAGLPDGLAADGALVAFGDGPPSFPRLCDRMLHGKRRIDVMLIVFDVLAIDGR